MSGRGRSKSRRSNVLMMAFPFSSGHLSTHYKTPVSSDSSIPRGRRSGGCRTSGYLFAVRIVAGGHSAHIAAEVGVTFSRGAQRRLEGGAERTSHESKDRGIGTGGFGAHEESL